MRSYIISSELIETNLYSEIDNRKYRVEDGEDKWETRYNLIDKLWFF